MTDIKRLGLGCMGMNLSNKERSIETIRFALDSGVTLLNTGEFYGGGESEMVLREALAGIPRDRYFLSVKFGVLPKPGGGIYGLDVKPWNVKAHLAYSLHRLGLDYVDLYQPARMDEAVPVEELIGALEECVQAGYVRHIGLTQLTAAELARAAKVHPIQTVELDYSLANRSIEQNSVLDTARENGIGILAFGVLSHGLLSDRPAGNVASGRPGPPPALKEDVIAKLREIAWAKNTTVEKLAQAYVYAKNPDMSVLIGTTSKAHLQDSIDALSLELTAKDVARIEAAFPAEKVSGIGMRNFTFRDGRVVRS
ncbi:MAG: aldo/keto reductase [Oscillospiraceae bacterium]|nr:aldo/keto reductase [Oscillospiraceae bacterium]